MIMDRLFVVKGQLQQIYAAYSKYIDKAVQFVLALGAFYLINHNLGFMGMLSSPAVTLALAVICTFLPVIATVWASALLILGHIYTISLGMLAVTAVIFLLMFIFYLKFSPKTAVFILLMPLAFLLKIPYTVPVALGLTGNPLSVVPVICGTIIYYMIGYVKNSAAALKSADEEGMIGQVTMFVKQIFQNKEMWIMIIAFVLCLLVVYTVRKMSVDHAWKIAIAAGAAVNIVVVAIGDVLFDVPVSYLGIIGGNIAAILLGMVLELLFFAVDYSRGEKLQFEDDEYYYYVKAIPKISVAPPEKTVKRINKREEHQETEIIDEGKMRNKSGNPRNRKPAQKRRTPQKNERHAQGNKKKSAEQMLMTRSLRKELNLDRQKD